MGSVRLPVQVGVDTLWRMAGASALAVPGIVIAISGVVLFAEGDSGGRCLLIGLLSVFAAADHKIRFDFRRSNLVVQAR